MRLLRGVPGAVLWILATVIGLVGLLLCVTVILLPLGIPLVKFAGRLFRLSVQLMLPRTLVHPVDELTKAADKRARKVSSAASDAAGHAAKEGRKFGTSASDTVAGVPKKGRKVARKQAKSVPDVVTARRNRAGDGYRRLLHRLPRRRSLTEHLPV